jgi:hypothetical protein
MLQTLQLTYSSSETSIACLNNKLRNLQKERALCPELGFCFERKNVGVRSLERPNLELHDNIKVNVVVSDYEYSHCINLLMN